MIGWVVGWLVGRLTDQWVNEGVTHRTLSLNTTNLWFYNQHGIMIMYSETGTAIEIG